MHSRPDSPASPTGRSSKPDLATSSVHEVQPDSAAEDTKRLRQRIDHLQFQLQQTRLQLQEIQSAYQDLRSRSLPVADLKDSAACAYLVLDTQGWILDCNELAVQWLGYSRQEMTGRIRWNALLEPAQRKTLLHPWRTLMRDGRLNELELRAVRKDGSKLDVLVNAVAERDAPGRVVRILVSLVDIAPRKLMRHDHPDWPMFQILADQLSECVSYWDFDSRLLFANRSFAAFCGVPVKRLQGNPMPDVLDPVLYSSMGDALQAVLAGEARAMESSYTARDGMHRYMQQRLIPDVRNGQLKGYFLWSLDVTEQRSIDDQQLSNEDLDRIIQQRASELYENEERLRLMADGVIDYCIYFLDQDGFITSWTASAERLHLHPTEDVIGQHFNMFSHEDESGRQTADHLLRIARARGQSERRGWVYRKDGSRLWTHSVITALRDDHGQLRGFSYIMHDMSEVKRAEDMQLNLQAELEQRVRDRTSELEMANKDLEAFSYSVSHDLRAPLRHITGYIDLLKTQCPAETLGDKANKYLDTITQAAQTMGQLIDGLLSFSRLGRATVNRGVVDFDSLVHGLQAMQQAQQEQRCIEWHIGPLPSVLGDSVLLREVWSNLLDNAVKYTRQQTHARIEIGCLPPNQVEQTFFVRDNGVGFDSKYANRLFGVFQRLHSAREFEGTGIGLALVKRIIERHGGRVWAESEIKQGSCFYFCLPVFPIDSPIGE